MNFPFVKMHGLGNAFVIAFRDQVVLDDAELPNLARQVCTHRTGIGADGLLLALRDGEDWRMEIYNSDGTIAEMCGNGIRCIARYLWDESLVSKRDFEIKTRSGPKRVTVYQEGVVDVEMGEATIQGELTLESADLPGVGFQVDVGNPHLVLPYDHQADDIARIGPILEHHPAMPMRTNVHTVEFLQSGISMKTWERGVGITTGCGTGACAVYAVARHLGKANERETIHLPGGDLVISERHEGGLVMAGPAEYVFFSV